MIKDKIIMDIRTLFEQEKEEDYYETKGVSNFWSNNHIEYESNDDKNGNLHLMYILTKLNLT